MDDLATISPTSKNIVRLPIRQLIVLYSTYSTIHSTLYYRMQFGSKPEKPMVHEFSSNKSVPFMKKVSKPMM